MPSVAVIIVGNEILTGKVCDENGPWLARRLRTLGADLCHMATVPDVTDAIADEVARCASRCDVVITAGGVGPTHDDVTIASVGRAFGLEMERREELVAILRTYGMPITDAAIRMATVPVGTDLVGHPPLEFPVYRVRNVYLFPGIPALLQEKFEAVSARFAGEAVHTARLCVDERETAIAERLEAAAARWPQVSIGSYPVFGPGPYRVLVTLDSRDAPALAEAREALAGILRIVNPKEE